MKTEITIDGITYKVGDVLERKGYKTIQILAMDDEAFFYKELDNNFEHLGCIKNLKHWKIKKPKKKLVVERWINIYKDGDMCIGLTKENVDKYANDNLIACEHVRFEYEIDEE